MATDAQFYADPSFPGVGRSLKLASNAALKERGVNAVMMVRAPWHDPRMDSLYKRLGASEAYHAHRLELNERSTFARSGRLTPLPCWRRSRRIPNSGNAPASGPTST